MRAAHADAVILAAGSVPVFPGFCKAAPNAVTADRVLSGAVAPGTKVLIMGGGLIGCETAEFLAERGHAWKCSPKWPGIWRAAPGAT